MQNSWIIDNFDAIIEDRCFSDEDRCFSEAIFWNIGVLLMFYRWIIDVHRRSIADFNMAELFTLEF